MTEPTTQHTPSPIFCEALRQLPAPTSDLIGRELYQLAGREWLRYHSVDHLDYHGEGIYVSLALLSCGHWTWSWSKKIAEGVHLRSWGSAQTLTAAAEAALHFEPERVTHEYLGHHQWYRTQERVWAAAIDGEEAAVIKRQEPDERGDYVWSRSHAAAAEVLDLTLGSKIMGNAATLDEAFRACVDAPERFKRACGAYIARITGASQPPRAPALQVLERAAGSAPSVEGPTTATISVMGFTASDADAADLALDTLGAVP